ncbi:nitrogenase iron-molybdenum cofactor biosynthesis protein NifN [Methylomonas sp. MED-D]|uniref:Nitrogenase iron-molybdenum cofactor biosynthesis protein NifN n=1 Tax=Methylomonas koyamae TaxID=702114 RepID=A0A177NK00_9GAMM|nr:MULTISPECIES: nitrogenase iron-molybdenum cofactor biosynthesis protein NifN [Methylomonas]MDT4332589.1 nitrogenase iron-molybdenum cofactor biosynthesis protein NifN [Methylomonas sp. MV1]OAI17360.1 nitrogenase molybdenum-cofactor biosynthesis protein NifN [Methylomonas koyamae]OHX34605.1 nitrogenase iron-molybdenum cofactor biosynthesis protein NifN [Methylomonas sp. LWB]WGS85252.1 nitrogenase iron-molybdenum cofactor biosynthesis protein NifN [Methylomonas sp. UP202]
MAEILKRKKALSVSPLKASAPTGGSLACLGFDRAIPMLHGSQGCTAFAKVFFVRHFREPIPLQTTAMDQASSVLGADENVVEGLKAIAEKSNPALIAVLTTGLAETQGCDVQRNVREFRAKYPEYDHVAVVAVNTPDFTGCVETGYAATIHEIVNALVPDAETAGTKPGNRRRQVNVLVSHMLTPGDLEALRDTIEMFGLRPVLVPDLSDSLDGSLTEDEFSPVTIGGTPVSELATLGEAKASLIIGPSLHKAGELLQEKTGVPSYFFEHLYGLEANDALILALAEISEQPVPQRIERQRAQLQDAMLDTHFMLGQLKVAIAADPDLLNACVHLIKGMGGDVVAAISPANAAILSKMPVSSVKIGDLEDLELTARENGAQLLIGNSHAVDSAERLGVPILRTGFPLYDIIGGYQKTWIGYRGTRQALFDLANLVINFAHEEIEVYHSPYSQKPENERHACSPSCH